MKLQSELVRLKEFQLNEKRRQFKQMEKMIAEFRRITNDLEQQIILEEQKSGISDSNHFAYPTFAKSARQRVVNLMMSIDNLLVQQEIIEAALADLESEYARVISLEGREEIIRSCS
ncbi:hypothetical protein B488_10310 [Liberibacter crescens BT-1]|uniref:Uncharacterized protein n=1 Tax=Liberibacter crescens (strain BT-1) TaxID=1215343 RepID=L0EWL5_LIBCB|nr:hypothetical protein [Liberibacter crescens]AGA65023.1 hypothetical protein B488_10310 [Liberibacter crescens BT-1]AMC13029.1 hypothetical protein RL73_05240 [Liberibacter crescens]